MPVDKDAPGELIEWMAQTVHQAYHTDQAGTFRECPRSVCDAARQYEEQVNEEPPPYPESDQAAHELYRKSGGRWGWKEPR